MIKGFSKTGKTTTVELLIRELRRRGYTVGTIKDIHYEDYRADVPGTDTFAHFQAGAYGTVVFSDHKYMVVKKQPEEARAGQMTPEQLASWFPEADLILLEGFKDSRWPKAEILMEGEPSVSREPMALISDWGWEGGLPHYTRNDVEGIARMIQETLHLVPPSGEHDEFGKDKKGNDGN